jgi:Cys-rich repeat protein
VRPRALLTATVLASSAGCGTQYWTFDGNGDAAAGADASAGLDAALRMETASRFDAAESADAEPPDDAMWWDDRGDDGARAYPSQDARLASCADDNDCIFPRVTLFCDVSSGKCVECREDSQCQQVGLQHCDLTKDRCVECLEDMHCPQGEVCTDSRQCVHSCADGGVCPSGTRCFAGYCQSCRDDSNCSYPTPVCVYRCVQCASSRDCNMPPLTHCNSATNRCVACLSSDDCPRQEQCDPASHVCVD